MECTLQTLDSLKQHPALTGLPTRLDVCFPVLSPMPLPVAPIGSDSCMSRSRQSSPCPLPTGTKRVSAPRCLQSPGPTTLVGGLTPQPRPHTRRWEPGTGNPRRDPPASFYLSGQPESCRGGHLFPGGCRSNPSGKRLVAPERTRTPA